MGSISSAKASTAEEAPANVPQDEFPLVEIYKHEGGVQFFRWKAMLEEIDQCDDETRNKRNHFLGSTQTGCARGMQAPGLLG